MNIDASSAPAWLITGCSSGIGREIAVAALARGYRVVLTARDPATVEDLRAAHPGQAIATALDVTKPDQIASALAAARSAFGGIDVLVNNAAYGYMAAVEEGEDDEIRAMFETNFFGLLAITRAVLPEMRERRSGMIINISSQAGLMSNPGTVFYSASKFAVEALTEGLSREVKPFGIRVCGVQPGPFRTDWGGRSLRQTRHEIADYAATVGARRAMIVAMNDKMPGDPKRAGKAIVELYDLPDPPLQLLLGRPVYDSYRAKLAGVQASLAEWEAVTLGADYPAGLDGATGT